MGTVRKPRECTILKLAECVDIHQYFKNLEQNDSTFTLKSGKYTARIFRATKNRRLLVEAFSEVLPSWRSDVIL